jgi:hypothetical protein
MACSPFLPGLLLAVTVWIGPLLARLIPSKNRAALSGRIPALRAWIPWLHGVGLPYAGLLAGWIAARDFGLSGQTPPEWLIGIVLAAAFGALLGRVSERFGEPRGWSDVRAESRWTLYRAAAGPWTGIPAAAVGVGLAAAAAEYLWRERPAGEPLFPEQGVVFLVRAGGSALLFLLAHNFFAAMLFYLIAVWTARADVWARVTGMLKKPARG